MTKKRILRIIALLTAVILAVLCVGACGNGSAITEEIETCPIPDGMTFDDLCGILSVYGHQVVLPCNQEEIIALDDRISRDPKADRQCVFSTDREASLAHIPSSGANSSSYFETVMIFVRDETFKSDLFAINGDIKFGTNIAAIKELFGEPISATTADVFGGEDLYYAYVEGDAALRLWIVSDADDRLCWAELMYTKWTKI